MYVNKFKYYNSIYELSILNSNHFHQYINQIKHNKNLFVVLYCNPEWLVYSPLRSHNLWAYVLAYIICTYNHLTCSYCVIFSLPLFIMLCSITKITPPLLTPWIELDTAINLHLKCQRCCCWLQAYDEVHRISNRFAHQSGRTTATLWTANTQITLIDTLRSAARQYGRNGR